MLLTQCGPSQCSPKRLLKSGYRPLRSDRVSFSSDQRTPREPCVLLGQHHRRYELTNRRRRLNLGLEFDWDRLAQHIKNGAVCVHRVSQRLAASRSVWSVAASALGSSFTVPSIFWNPARTESSTPKNPRRSSSPSSVTETLSRGIPSAVAYARQVIS
jgi:hypothetical protein